MSDERGSASLLAVGVMAFLLVVGAAVAAAAGGLLAVERARTAADAAALAAAPVTFRPFGGAGDPAAEAARFAGLNGGSLVRCVCPPDGGWATRVVEVEVAVAVDLPGLGSRSFAAVSRAEFEPVALLEGGGG